MGQIFRSNTPPSTPSPGSSMSSEINVPPTISKDQSTRSNLRRNSISMPMLNKLDLDAIQHLDEISQTVRTIWEFNQHSVVKSTNYTAKNALEVMDFTFVVCSFYA